MSCSTDLDEDGFAPIAAGGRDCDDTDPALNGLDADGDGQSTCEGDCDDSDPLTFLGAEEIANEEIDQDCDGSDLFVADLDEDGICRY